MKRSAFLKLSLCAFIPPALADTYPSRPIRIIVPFAAGGISDKVARLMAQEMSKTLGQAIIVEPRPGAGGNIGGAAVAKAAPDGYTLLMGAINNFSVNQYVFKEMPYDPFAFTWIKMAIDIPQVFVVNSKLPVRSLKDLVEFAKSNQVNLGSQGIGTTTQIALEMLNQAAGVKIEHIPYKGSSAVVPALLGEQVHVAIGGLSNMQGLIKSGALRPLAVTSKTRIAALPDVPTTTEAGFPSVVISNWFGLAAPKGLDPLVAKRIHEAAVRSLKVAAVQRAIEDGGQTVIANKPEEMEAEIRKSAELFRRTIEVAGIEKQ